MKGHKFIKGKYFFFYLSENLSHVFPHSRHIDVTSQKSRQKISESQKLNQNTFIL